MWTVEYSKSQKAYHIDEESNVLEKEIEVFLETGWVGDWDVLGRFETLKEAEEFSANHRANNKNWKPKF